MTRRGFTLVELVVVLCVLGILATIAVPKVNDARVQAEATALIERIVAVETAIAAAGDYRGPKLLAPRGVVPEALAPYLTPGHFKGELGTLLYMDQGSSTRPRPGLRVSIGSNPSREKLLLLQVLRTSSFGRARNVSCGNSFCLFFLY
ncbi:MAG: prepilin-type N-terminal cleavage/methylation domain-containing protein [Gemmatimonadota bacterium]|jgi:prepilin-type N-terminal cleavage/methylation domain-containing protein